MVSNDLPRSGARHLLLVLTSLPPGFGIGQLSSLAAIAAQPGLSVNDLAAGIGAPQQTASRYVAQLTGRYQDSLDAGPNEPLIEQRVNASDPRSRALYLTERGHAIITAFLSVQNAQSSTEEA